MAKHPSPVRIKICGMTRLRDALAAVNCGADAVGFIFYKKSPRHVTEKTVKTITAQLPPFVNRVGVFVNEPLERVNRIAKSCGLDVVQLHGDETPAYCKKIQARVLKVVRVKNPESLKDLARYAVDGFLLDAFQENVPGGTGLTFDWNLARRARKYGNVILAGGLHPGNVAEAIHRVQPYGVDVCSGVEKSPGKKDYAKVREFITVVRATTQE